MKAIVHMITESMEPATAARPIGSSVSANIFDARYAPGTRASSTDRKLCRKDIPDFPYAQKYPLKQKCIPANIQSATYPLKY